MRQITMRLTVTVETDEPMTTEEIAEQIRQTVQTWWHEKAEITDVKEC